MIPRLSRRLLAALLALVCLAGGALVAYPLAHAEAPDATMPAFAQIYQPQGESLRLLLSQPVSRTLEVAPASHRVQEPGVRQWTAESGGHLLTWWLYESCAAQPCSDPLPEIEYRVLRPDGEPLTPIRRLTSTDSPYIVSRRSPVTAISPNGTAAIAWHLKESDLSGNARSNIEMAFVRPDGSASVVIPLTRNIELGKPSTQSTPQRPRIVATRDNRFVVAWEAAHPDADGQIVSDLYIALYDTTGRQLRATTPLTNSDVDNAYEGLALATYGNDQLVVIFLHRPSYELFFLRLTSDGTPLGEAVQFTQDGVAFVSGLTALEVGVDRDTGQIIVAWSALADYETGQARVRYTVLELPLDPATPVTGEQIRTTQDLTSPAPANVFVSLARQGEQVVATWTDAGTRTALYRATLALPAFAPSPTTTLATGAELSLSSHGQGLAAYQLPTLYLPFVRR